MAERSLYVVFSSTPYKMGRFIRRITGQTYNHISISLEPSLSPMYGFARRYYTTPFYGGFVEETPARYWLNGTPAQVKICRIPLTEAQYTVLRAHLMSMYRRKEHYLYNHLSALFTPLRWRIPVKDAYLCVEFCADILQRSGIAVNPRHFYSIGDIEQILDPFRSYQGDFPVKPRTDPAFFAPRPLQHPVYRSLISILALLPRIGQQ